MLKTFIKGFSTGFILQLALGPVFFYTVSLALQRSLADGLAAVAGVTLADYLFISLALMGTGQLVQRNSIRKILGVLSSIILLIFGIFMIIHIIGKTNLPYETIETKGNLFSSFISALMLTLSSPLTILFWTGLFSARALGYNFSKRQLIFFGLSAGLSTVLFLGTAVILSSLFRASVPFIYVKILNLLIGIILIIYGISRLIKTSKER